VGVIFSPMPAMVVVMMVWALVADSRPPFG
jgi:hypothetical protein